MLFHAYKIFKGTRAWQCFPSLEQTNVQPCRWILAPVKQLLQKAIQTFPNIPKLMILHTHTVALKQDVQNQTYNDSKEHQYKW